LFPYGINSLRDQVQLAIEQNESLVPMATFIFFSATARAFFVPADLPTGLTVYRFFFFTLVAGTCIGVLAIPIGSYHLNTS